MILYYCPNLNGSCNYMFPMASYEEANLSSIAKNDSCFEDLVRFNTEGCPARDNTVLWVFVSIYCFLAVLFMLVLVCATSSDYYHINYHILNEEERIEYLRKKQQREKR